MLDKHHPLTVIIASIIVMLIASLFDRGPSLPPVAIQDDPLCIIAADTSACESYWRKTLAAKAAAGDDDPLGLFEPPAVQPPASRRP